MTRRNVKNKFVIAAVVIVVLAAVVFAASRLISGGNSSSASNSNSSNNSDTAEPRASQDVNKTFEFPVGKNADNKIIFTLEKAEILDEIVVRGQKATAVSGRTFLIVNLKVTNELSQRIEMDTRDYVRLSVNGNDKELLAPDIHNDPVEIQATSTKFGRVGFPINTTDKNLVLLVGEIGKDREKVELTINP